MIGKTICHYKIIEKLGEGGMGVVHLAEDTKLDRKVALKSLPHAVSANATERKRFIVEAKAAAALNHPNIATIHAIEEADNELFLVMEYVEGWELRDMVGAHGDVPLQINVVLNYASQIAKGLQTAHDKGIIHRDIKSSNIMVTGKGQVKIMDFGLAKMGMGIGLTKEYSTLGTLSYMSPEQIQGQPADARSDIWSFGVVLYEMLTGKLPFKAEYEQVLMFSIFSEEPEAVKNIRDDCPDSFESIISKCLQKNPKERFQEMSEILEALNDRSFKTTQQVGESEKHNLPVQLTSFIGRKKEIETIKQLLKENRLVTLTGAGGCGKTRLAQQVAERMVEKYNDGVWIVELAPVTDSKRISQVIASVLQVTEEANVLLEETITKRIKQKHLLLLLDNCEHLINACSEIVEKFLISVTNLRILATSREALNIPGELAWRVPSLSFPKPDSKVTIDELDQYESLSLFADRAKSNNPSFNMSEQNIEIIARICERLDGIPLALELAASRLKMFSPESILERLDNRFQLLTGGSRTALERQKTLRATIDWSYDLLTENEKNLLNRLSVFVGGCDITAAEGVCGVEPLTRNDICELLSHLIDKSLVVSETAPGGLYRYRLLETLRHYASERLFENNESALMKKRHFNYFLNYADTAYEEHLKKNQFWLEKINLDHNNILAALEYIDHDSEQFTQLAGAMGWYWFAHSYFSLGHKLLNEALKNRKKINAANARARYSLGLVSSIDGSITFVDELENSTHMWRKIGDKKGLALGLIEFGTFKPLLQEFEAADKALMESENIAKDIDDEYLLLRARTGIAFLNINQYKPDIAEPIAIQNLKTAIELSLVKDILWNRHIYADCALMKKNYRESEKRYAEAISGALEFKNFFQAGNELHGVAMSLSGQKRYEKALRLNGAVHQKFDELGITMPGGWFWSELLDKYIGEAINTVGPEQAQVLDQEGRKMGFEKAMEYALDFDKD